MSGTGQTVTVLFTDLVNSTDLMQRAGDDEAQKIFRAHYEVLRDAVAEHGGAEVKSLGDGLMVVFASAADAVRCAIAMQQVSRRAIHGTNLDVRVGLNAGDALRDEGDYFGTTVVTARRLCDRARPGQILCSHIVEGLLAGRQAFSFKDLGLLELKGIAAPMATREVLFDAAPTSALPGQTPFVGRDSETLRLRRKLDEASKGHGALVMVVGEPGIGKSRMIGEFTTFARANEVIVIAGACYEGEWSPPYAPFIDALSMHAKTASSTELRSDMGLGAPALARLVPAIRQLFPDIDEPPPLQPDEERFRLFDAVAQLLIAVSRRAPLVVVLDDLHWADRGTIAMLRHVVRYLPRERMLLLGAYRDVELDRQHPLSDALAALRREVEYERIALKGLDEAGVGALLAAVTEHVVPDPFVRAISEETDGNPFFIREVLIHLTEEGKIFQRDGQWTSDLSIEQMGIPEGVRQVIGRRLSRLSEGANRLLTCASGFSGGFRIDIVARSAEMDESTALDATDEALAAQVIRATGQADVCEFTHALIRHTLYGELTPPRQVRLHRGIADAMERIYGPRAMEHAGELAYQFHRGGGLPGMERGVTYAEAAAQRAEEAGGWDESVTFLRMALDLLPETSDERGRITANLAIALAWSQQFDECVKVATDAASLLATKDGDAAAAMFLAEVARAAWSAGGPRACWALGNVGLRYAGDRHDATWAWLMAFDIARRDADDPDSLGIAVNSPERRMIADVAKREIPQDDWILRLAPTAQIPTWNSRSDALSSLSEDGDGRVSALSFIIGDARAALAGWLDFGERSERRGQIAGAAACWAMAARCHAALGAVDAAKGYYRRSLEMIRRCSGPSVQALQVAAAFTEVFAIIGEGEDLAELREITALAQPGGENTWATAVIRATLASRAAGSGDRAPALAMLRQVLPAIELASVGAPLYPMLVFHAARALWLLNASELADVIAANTHEKVIGPDFRFINHDGRLALARLLAVQSQYDEASRWFAEARRRADESGELPWRAIADFDETLMLTRRNDAGDGDRARPLLESALRQFQEIGMTGWLRRAELLAQQMN